MMKVRCGICGCMNDLSGVEKIRPGEGLECGWCAGVTTIHLVGPTGGASRRRRPREGFRRPLWGGYVDSTAVALRDAWRARIRRALES